MNTQPLMLEVLTANRQADLYDTAGAAVHTESRSWLFRVIERAWERLGDLVHTGASFTTASGSAVSSSRPTRG